MNNLVLSDQSSPMMDNDSINSVQKTVKANHFEDDEQKRISMTERNTLDLKFTSQTNILAEEALKKLENDFNKHKPR